MTPEDVPRNSIAHPKSFSEDYWLRRAKMTRSKAASAQDPRLRQRLQRVAHEYERLAACAAQRSAPAPSAKLDHQLSFVL